MTLNTQMKILNTKNYYQYFKENSNWIKELNRDENNIKNFIEFIKDKYSLKLTDRIENIINGAETLSNVLEILN